MFQILIFILKFKFLRINKLAKCKQDCNYRILLSSNYTNDTSQFIRNVVKSLPQAVSSTCASTLSKFMTAQPVNAQNILSNLSKFHKI